MEAKDKRMADYSDGECYAYQRGYRHGAEAQAEITWKAREPEIKEARKAGYDEGLGAGDQARYDIGVGDGKVEGVAEGISEVVEQVGLCCYIWHDEENKAHICLNKEDWQAKLKEWGIK